MFSSLPMNRLAVVAWQSACASFALQNLTDVELIQATYYTANTALNISNIYTTLATDNLPAFCRVELSITTNVTANSTCNTEVWLPDSWNGRFLALGNGGLAGGVNVAELGHVAVTQGFAGVSTDTGHTSDENDGEWAGPYNDNAIIDWSWRALHLSVVAGKEVVKQYYNQSQNKSYYLGCSTGGRQGLKEVQAFPDDFDGAIVGSPANWQTHVQAWSIHMNLDVQPPNSTRFINQTLWENVIHPEVLRQCDHLDGLTDGIINDPRFCNFRPARLACRTGQDSTTCLTVPQIEALNRIYTDYYEADQTWIFGSYYPGGEIEYPAGLVGEDPFAIGVDYFRYFVLNDTEWTIEDYNASLIGIADAIDPGQANAINPNITAFAGPAHNGKLLHYVGWADQLISPGNTLHYYETIHTFMTSHTDMDVDDFYRLFTVPGMNHCKGGFGANAFGSVEQASNGMPPFSLEPEYNILAAMVQWVEQGIAPSSLKAVYYNNNSATNGVGFERPICQYPRTLRYDGGNQTSADGFSCV
ncbi:hypothetical protein AcV5_008705 [Taiwanofungus camphoratus]|nr:hypothetical protein AcV5_008705 [Antrodia cinnamomea]